MKKVIITGASGMIGISLINYLLKQNCEILAIIRENTPRRKYIPDDSRIKIVECNLENIKNLELSNFSKYDIFYHFGWTNTNNKETRDLIDLQNLNIDYTLDCVKLAQKLGCKKFIGAGSQSEFGIVDGIINENIIENPKEGYGKAKYEAGIQSRNLANKLGMEHIWTRIFSVYGPYDRDTTMVMSSIKEMLNRKFSRVYRSRTKLGLFVFRRCCECIIFSFTIRNK